jgi:peptidyl-dipeptidase Dcp
MRQLSFGMLDMGWHTRPFKYQGNKSFEIEQFADTIVSWRKENAMSTSFSHIFQGGYSSGYYSYKWAEVLDADIEYTFKKRNFQQRSSW